MHEVSVTATDDYLHAEARRLLEATPEDGRLGGVIRALLETVATRDAVVVCGLGQVLTPEEAGVVLGMGRTLLSQHVRNGRLQAVGDGPFVGHRLDDVMALREVMLPVERDLAELFAIGEEIEAHEDAPGP